MVYFGILRKLIDVKLVSDNSILMVYELRGEFMFCHTLGVPESLFKRRDDSVSSRLLLRDS